MYICEALSGGAVANFCSVDGGCDFCVEGGDGGGFLAAPGFTGGADIEDDEGARLIKPKCAKKFFLAVAE